MNSEDNKNISKSLSKSSMNNLPIITHWGKIKRLSIFQLKLAIDTLRDVVLSPFSIIATLLDIIEDKQGKHSYFERLLDLGRRSDRKINLFDQHDDNSPQEFTVDSVVDQIESIVKTEYQQGELSGTAKKALAKYINALKNAGKY